MPLNDPPITVLPTYVVFLWKSFFLYRTYLNLPKKFINQGWKKCRTAGPWSQKFFAFLTESFLSDNNLFSRKIKLSAESKVSIKFLEKLSQSVKKEIGSNNLLQKDLRLPYLLQKDKVTKFSVETCLLNKLNPKLCISRKFSPEKR